MNSKWILAIGMTAMMLLSIGCSGGQNTTTPQTEAEIKAAEEAANAEAAAAAIPVPIPATSPFAKIKYGMDQQEVYSILGQPTSQGAYVTGKAWIPFYFGGDKTRQIARYKGEGYIVFSQNHSFTSSNSVQTIYYDPNENGFE